MNTIQPSNKYLKMLPAKYDKPDESQQMTIEYVKELTKHVKRYCAMSQLIDEGCCIFEKYHIALSMYDFADRENCTGVLYHLPPIEALLNESDIKPARYMKRIKYGMSTECDTFFREFDFDIVQNNFEYNNGILQALQDNPLSFIKSDPFIKSDADIWEDYKELYDAYMYALSNWRCAIEAKSAVCIIENMLICGKGGEKARHDVATKLYEYCVNVVFNGTEYKSKLRKLVAYLLYGDIDFNGKLKSEKNPFRMIKDDMTNQYIVNEICRAFNKPSIKPQLSQAYQKGKFIKDGLPKFQDL